MLAVSVHLQGVAVAVRRRPADAVLDGGAFAAVFGAGEEMDGRITGSEGLRGGQIGSA